MLHHIGQIHLTQHNFTKARCLFEEAEGMLKRVLSLNKNEHSPTLAVVYNCLGELSLQLKDAERALWHRQRASTIFEHRNITAVIDYITCLLINANANYQVREYHQAQKTGSEALAALKIISPYIQLKYKLFTALQVWQKQKTICQ